MEIYKRSNTTPPEYKKESNYTIMHPFHIGERETDTSTYLKWGIAAEKYGLGNNPDDIYLALVHRYYGVATFSGKYVIATEAYFKSNIELIFKELNKIPDRILPLGEQLDFELAVEILKCSGHDIFRVNTMYGLYNTDLISLTDLISVYRQYPCLELKSQNDDFVFKSREDSVETLISFNNNDNLKLLMDTLQDRIDVERLIF